MTPLTTIGRIVGAFCGIFGVIIIAMPVGFIASKFSELHKDQALERGIVKSEKKKLSNKFEFLSQRFIK